MGLFDLFKKDKGGKLDFSNIDSNDKAIELAEKGVVYPLYLMPLRFNGEESIGNRVFAPKVTIELKDRFDDMVEELLVNEKVNGYECSPEYKGKSFIPCKITMKAKYDDKVIFTETIDIC